MDIAAELNIRPWELDQLTVRQFLRACALMQRLRDEAAEAKRKAQSSKR